MLKNNEIVEMNERQQAMDVQLDKMQTEAEQQRMRAEEAEKMAKKYK